MRFVSRHDRCQSLISDHRVINEQQGTCALTTLPYLCPLRLGRTHKAGVSAGPTIWPRLGKLPRSSRLSGGEPGDARLYGCYPDSGVERSSPPRSPLLAGQGRGPWDTGRKRLRSPEGSFGFKGTALPKGTLTLGLN